MTHSASLTAIKVFFKKVLKWKKNFTMHATLALYPVKDQNFLFLVCFCTYIHIRK